MPIKKTTTNKLEKIEDVKEKPEAFVKVSG